MEIAAPVLANVIIPTWAKYTAGGLFVFPTMLVVVSLVEMVIILRACYGFHPIWRIAAMVLLANAVSTGAGVVVLVLAPMIFDHQLSVAMTVASIAALCLLSCIIEVAVLLCALPKAPRRIMVFYVCVANIMSYQGFYLVTDFLR